MTQQWNMMNMLTRRLDMDMQTTISLGYVILIESPIHPLKGSSPIKASIYVYRISVWCQNSDWDAQPCYCPVLGHQRISNWHHLPPKNE